MPDVLRRMEVGGEVNTLIWHRLGSHSFGVVREPHFFDVCRYGWRADDDRAEFYFRFGMDAFQGTVEACVAHISGSRSRPDVNAITRLCNQIYRDGERNETARYDWILAHENDSGWTYSYVVTGVLPFSAGRLEDWSNYVPPPPDRPHIPSRTLMRGHSIAGPVGRLP
jgi:hypothetical protein